MRAALGVLCLLGASCGGAGSPSARFVGDVSDAGTQPPAWKRRCEEYAGAPVRVSYEDASGGAAVLYRTKGDVAALRARTAEIARAHNSARLGPPALHDLFPIPHSAHVEELRDGAKLVLIPKSANPRLLADLRRNVQQEVNNMQKRGCGRGQEAL